MQFAPAFFAISINFFAMIKEPLWLIPASAITNTGYALPIFCLPMIISFTTLCSHNPIY